MKNSIKIVIGIVIGIMVSFVMNIAAETMLSSEQVSYSGSKTEQTTVKGTLDELFSAVEINEEIEQLKTSISNLQNRIDNMYPIGSIYISENNDNPSSLFGGTWERYGVGRTLVSTDGTSGKTGGNATATLTVNNLPSHTHSVPALSGTAANAGAHIHSFVTGGYALVVNSNSHLSSMGEINLGFLSGTATWYSGTNKNQSTIQSSGAHTHSVTTNASTTGSTGSGTSFSVQDPYITVYMWKRTA